MANVKEILEEMHAEGTGSRGVFYENYGSGIRHVLEPLAELLDNVQDDYPELVETIATGLYKGY